MRARLLIGCGLIIVLAVASGIAMHFLRESSPHPVANHPPVEPRNNTHTSYEPLPVTTPAPDPDGSSPLHIQVYCSGSHHEALRIGSFVVGIANRGSKPVVLVLRGGELAAKIAWFEVESTDGTVVAVPALPMADISSSHLQVVQPGEKWGGPFGGWKTLAPLLRKPTTRSVRFVYDASEGSEYQRLAKADGDSVLLPEGVHVSQKYVLVE